jgi:hypothetical protein
MLSIVESTINFAEVLVNQRLLEGVAGFPQKEEPADGDQRTVLASPEAKAIRHTVAA